MKYKNKNGFTRYLAGFFLTPEKIMSQEVKNSKNVYKTIAELEYIDFKVNPLESFSINCKKVGRDPRFSSNFESGNLFIAMKVLTKHLCRKDNLNTISSSRMTSIPKATRNGSIL